MSKSKTKPPVKTSKVVKKTTPVKKPASKAKEVKPPVVEKTEPAVEALMKKETPTDRPKSISVDAFLKTILK